MYNLYLKYQNGTIFELPFETISFTDELNKGKNASFTFDYLSLKDIADKLNVTVNFLITGGYREIYLEKDETKVYNGVITDYSLSRNSDNGHSIQVSSVDYFVLLGKRFTDNLREFTSTEASTIAWTLIEESQASDTYADLGITQGATITSKNRNRTFRFDNVKDEITKMTNSNLEDGFDCDIDNDKAFNCYYPQKGQNRTEIYLDDKNIMEWRYRKPLLMSLVNKVYVVGAGFNDDILYVTRESNDTYKESFTLLGNVLSERQVETTDTLNDKGDKYLSNNQSPIAELTLVVRDDDPDILNYDIGDSVKITIDELQLNEDYKRIIKRQINIDSNGMGLVTLTVQ